MFLLLYRCFFSASVARDFSTSDSGTLVVWTILFFSSRQVGKGENWLRSQRASQLQVNFDGRIGKGQRHMLSLFREVKNNSISSPTSSSSFCGYALLNGTVIFAILTMDFPSSLENSISSVSLVASPSSGATPVTGGAL